LCVFRLSKQQIIMVLQWGTNSVRTFDTGAAAAAGGISTGTGALGGGGGTAGTFSFGATAPAPSLTTAFPSSSLGGTAATTAAAAPANTSAAVTAAAPFGFGAAPASAVPSFGTPAPSASFPGIGGGGMFGSPAPAPATASAFGFFGQSSSTSTTASPGLFGGSSTTTAASGFGAGFGQTQQQQQQQQPAAQAALQAHQNAEARQEEARVVAALTAIHRAYSGTAVCPDDGAAATADLDFAQPSSAPFTLIYYTDISPELRQQQWLQGMIVGGGGGGLGGSGQQEGGGAAAASMMVRPVVPPRPWQVSSRDWRAAAARNPDPATHMPAVLLGASALQSRISYQQESATKLTQQFQLVRDTLEALAQQSERLQREVANKVRHRHEQQRSRLLSVMRKVELVRSFQIPIQHGELQALERLANLHRELERTVQPTIRHLHDRAEQQQLQQQSGGRGENAAPISASLSLAQISDLENVLKNEFGPGIVRMQRALEKPVRDVALLKKRIEHAPLPALPPPPSLRR
jgi:Nucleoporin complex subunit 54